VAGSTRAVDLLGQALADEPDDGLRAVADLRAELDSLEAEHVSRALRAGATWAEIGAALGVSKQAAHRKYARRPLVAPTPGERHELLISSDARLAVVMARSEAAARGDTVVGTEHLLLGMIQQGEGGACEALKAVGVTLQAARVQVDLFFPTPFADMEPSRLPLSEAARAALERATGEVVKRGDRKLRTVHLLLALLRDPESRAVKTLTGLGVALSDVEASTASCSS
jgi:hypothetical protein